jgi:hypothetical protein
MGVDYFPSGSGVRNKTVVISHLRRGHIRSGYYSFGAAPRREWATKP